jgi:hypothetical protein
MRTAGSTASVFAWFFLRSRLRYPLFLLSLYPLPRIFKTL